MVSRVSLPRGDVHLGFAGPNRIPVVISMEWMRVFTDLVARTGGETAIADMAAITEAAFAPRTDARVDECLRAVNELSGELASTRGDLQSARARIEELEAAVASLPTRPDLTDRVQQLEDRLA